MNDIRAEVSQVLYNLDNKPELNSQDKRDYMLISVFLGQIEQNTRARAETPKISEYGANNSIQAHAEQYINLKRLERSGNSTAKQQAIRELKLMALELNDTIAEVAKYTDSEAEREVLTKINLDMVYKK